MVMYGPSLKMKFFNLAEKDEWFEAVVLLRVFGIGIHRAAMNLDGLFSAPI